MARKLTEKAVLSAIKGSGGNRNEIARRLKCDWHTANDFIFENPEIKKAYEEEKETEIEEIEYKGLELAKNGDGRMIRFILSTIGKSRGYTTTEESNVADAEEDNNVSVTCDGPDVDPIPTENE